MLHLFVSNGRQVKSGYGVQTDLIVPRLHNPPYREMAIFDFVGLAFSAIKDSQGILTLPRANAAYGNDIVVSHAEFAKADNVISLIDPHVLDSSQYSKLHWTAWTPVDCDPLLESSRDILRSAKIIWGMSHFGMDILKRAGMPANRLFYVPLAVDGSQFRPMNKAKAREVIEEKLGVSLAGRFVVVMNAANSGMPSRKGFLQAFRAVKAFDQKHPDKKILLLCHTNPQDIRGENLYVQQRLAGLRADQVIYPQEYFYECGMFSPKYLAALYNTADVFLTTSFAEGFGLPLVEAQMCGTPVIAGDYSSMPELNFGDWKVRALARVHADVGRLWWLPDENHVVELLEDAYAKRGDEQLRARVMAGAAEYEIENVMQKYVLPAVQFAEEHATRRKLYAAGKLREKVSVVTPWMNNAHFIPEYEKAVRGFDEVVIIDNGSDQETSQQLLAMVERLGGIYHRNADNAGFGAACNQGLALASGDYVLMLNNDIAAIHPDWHIGLGAALLPDAILGSSARTEPSTGVPYIEGWCMVAHRDVWRALQGFDAAAFPVGYYEDVDLCFRAVLAGYGLREIPCDVQHLGAGNTSSKIPNWQQIIDKNRETFVKRVQQKMAVSV